MGVYSWTRPVSGFRLPITLQNTTVISFAPHGSLVLLRWRRLRQIFLDDAVIAFLKIVGWLLVPVVFAFLGLVLLTSIPTALIWVASIVIFALLYVRFSDRHVEHVEYDDKLDRERWIAAREKYFKMMEKDENKDGKKK